MLQVNEIDQYYGGSHILRGLTFEARVGKSLVYWAAMVSAKPRC